MAENNMPHYLLVEAMNIVYIMNKTPTIVVHDVIATKEKYASRTCVIVGGEILVQ